MLFDECARARWLWCACARGVCVLSLAYMHTCMHAYMHACIHAYMHICMHAYMHTCIHAYMLSVLFPCAHSLFSFTSECTLVKEHALGVTVRCQLSLNVFTTQLTIALCPPPSLHLAPIPARPGPCLRLLDICSARAEHSTVMDGAFQALQQCLEEHEETAVDDSDRSQAARGVSSQSIVHTLRRVRTCCGGVRVRECLRLLATVFPSWSATWCNYARVPACRLARTCVH